MTIEKMTSTEFNKTHPNFFIKKKSGNKFGAKKLLLDGKIFDSTSEGDLYAELKLQEQQGLIKGFDTQVKEELCAYGQPICNYFVDFRIDHLDGTQEFLEHKGRSTPEWWIKFKMLEAKYKDDKNTKLSINWYRSKYQYKQKFQYRPKT